MTCRGPSTRRHRRRHQHHPRIRRAGWCIRATTTAGSRHLLTRRRCTTLRWHRGLPFWVPARRSISRTAALPRPTQTRPPSTWAAPPTSSTRRPTRTSRSSSSEHPSRAHGTHWKSLCLPATTGLLNNNRPSPTPLGGRRHFFFSVDAPVLPPPDAPPPLSPAQFHHDCTNYDNVPSLLFTRFVRSRNEPAQFLVSSPIASLCWFSSTLCAQPLCRQLLCLQACGVLPLVIFFYLSIFFFGVFHC